MSEFFEVTFRLCPVKFSQLSSGGAAGVDVDVEVDVFKQLLLPAVVEAAFAKVLNWEMWKCCEYT